MEVAHFQPIAQSNSMAGEGNSVLEGKFKKNECLMRRMAASLGLSGAAYQELRNEVWERAKAGSDFCAGTPTFRIWFLKATVHACAFRINAGLFGDPACSEAKPAKWKFDAFSGQDGGGRHQNLPLSFRLALILYKELGLNEDEIAAVMNVSRQRIRERLKKVLLSKGK